MFGWLKKKVRNENLKLVKQNQLAALYIKSFSETACELGQAESQELFGLMFGVATQADSLLSTLEITEALSQNEVDEQFRINRDLRRIYDDILAGRKAFASQFGTASEPLLSFDRKFTPNEGWKNFVNHFDSM